MIPVLSPSLSILTSTALIQNGQQQVRHRRVLRINQVISGPDLATEFPREQTSGQIVTMAMQRLPLPIPPP